MLKKALTTTALATVLLTSSISANELTSIKAFDNIPTQNLNSTELNEKGEFFWFYMAAQAGAIGYAIYWDYQNVKNMAEENNNNNYVDDYY